MWNFRPTGRVCVGRLLLSPSPLLSGVLWWEGMGTPDKPWQVLRQGPLRSQWDVLEISLARSSEGSEWGRAVRGLPGRLL